MAPAIVLIVAKLMTLVEAILEKFVAIDSAGVVCNTDSAVGLSYNFAAPYNPFGFNLLNTSLTCDGNAITILLGTAVLSTSTLVTNVITGLGPLVTF